MIPARGLLKVKPVETSESLPGSAIILIADARNRMTANQCEVLAVGAFAVCEDEECERGHATECCRTSAQDCDSEFNNCAVRLHVHTFAVGDWLLVEPRSYIDGPEPERREWFVHQDKVLVILGHGDGM